jgi:hypothetical protein
LHVPDLELVVTGDAVYGACHQYLLETATPELRAQWLRAIDGVEALGVKYVVPSHKQAWEGFGTEHFEGTREYIRTWERELVGARDEVDLEGRMRTAFPERVGEFILDLSAGGAFGTVVLPG